MFRLQTPKNDKNAKKLKNLKKGLTINPKYDILDTSTRDSGFYLRLLCIV